MKLSLYASLHFQTCFQSARVSDFSPHVIYAVK